MPHISVIVPNYNHAQYLRQRIDSILNQTYQDFELILLDDCSTDNSREVLLSYKDNPHVTQIVFNKANVGSPYKQWKNAIELANCEWIWIAESDDVADPTFLETLYKEAQTHPSYGLVYCASNIINQHNEVTLPAQCQKDEPTKIFAGVESLLYGQFSIWNVSSALIRREAVLHTDVPYTSLRYSGDIFFYTSVLEHFDIVKVPYVLNNYRIHQKNLSTSLENSGLGKYENLKILHYFYTSLSYHDKWRLLHNYSKGFCKGAAKFSYKRDVVNKALQEVFRINPLFVVDFLILWIAYQIKWLIERHK